jgi:Nuclease-related domain
MRRKNRPGGYAQRRHKELRKAWQRRVFPRWPLYLTILAAVIVFVGTLLPNPFKTMLMVFGFSLALFWWVITEALAPDHIRRWQRGAWGEQMTASELKPLRKRGWIVRHDIQTRHGNHDHIAIGRGVYLLETKYLTDSEMTLEPGGLRIRRIDQPTDDYLMDGLTELMERRGRALWRSLRQATQRSIYVHPVVVLWGRFEPEVAHVRKVTYVHGNHLARWLESQPHELGGTQLREVTSWLNGYSG